MTEQMIAACRKRRRKESVVRVFGFYLPILAVIVACCISFLSKMPIPIENPIILLLASLFILVPFKSKLSIKTLQKIIGFYLFAVLVNESSSQYFRNHFLPLDIDVSCSTVILSLCAMGFLVGRVKSTGAPRSSERTYILYSWLLVMVIIVVHMILLSLMLKNFYGYGCERNLSVLGNLCLYFLLFIFLWEKLDKLRFRQGIGLILAVFYFALIVVKG